MITLHAWRVRRAMEKYARYLYAQRARLGYAEVRPMRSFPTPYMRVPAHDTDCSESSAIVAQASGAPTPYVRDREGYTGTMLDTLPHIEKKATRRGDFAVFVRPGVPTGEHVVILLQGGRRYTDPLVFSHGAPGAYIVRLSQEASYHRGASIVFLKSVPDRL